MPRTRTSEMESLEALLLGVMDKEGIVTAHGLYRNLILSPASTIRALYRLSRLGYASREGGERGRRTAYRITDEGRIALHRGWREYVWSGRSDPEEILRFVTLADLLGEDWQSEDCPSRLRDIAGERRARASSLLTTARFKKKSALSRYRLWRAISEAGKMQGESRALDEIADMLERESTDDTRGDNSEIPNW